MKFTFSASDGKESFQNSMGREIKGIGATRAALGRMLRSIDFVGWSHSEETGRLDRKALPRVKLGATSVFSRRAAKVAERSAVTVMVDCSGSMMYCMDSAQNVTIQLGKLLEQSRVNFAVTGFTGSEPSDGYDPKLRCHVEHVDFIPFKTRGESMIKAAAKLGNINNGARSGNPDYSALMFCIEEIKSQPEQRKIVFFLTDTGSYSPEAMAQVQKSAAAFKVEIIAIGIGTEGINKLFKHGVDVRDVDDLGGKTFKQLLTTLKAGD
jgi:cobalamin biosynthesis protein CobT